MSPCAGKRRRCRCRSESNESCETRTIRMLDSRYVAFVTLSALLVISPGATLAVVTETALAFGRTAAFLAVVGIGVANAALASATSFGLAGLLHRWPAAQP